MIHSNPIPEQLQAVLSALTFGICLGLLYDLFRLLRWSFHSRILTFVLDFIFSILSAGTLFLLVTAVTQLRLRGYLPVSMAVGWLFWLTLPGRLFRWTLRYISSNLQELTHVCRQLLPISKPQLEKNSELQTEFSKK